MQMANQSCLVKPLPKWVMKRYAVLWDNFGAEAFSFDHANSALNIDREILSLVFSEMKKAGWISVDIDPQDSRKRIYRLIEPSIAMKCMSNGGD